MINDISVVIPSIPPRAKLLRRAFHSVTLQSLPAAAVIVELDHNHTGAAATRHRALSKVDTEWVAFLDDDDVLDPNHLETLRVCAEEYGADYVWSQFRLRYPNGTFANGPTPLGEGTFSQWDDNSPAQTTITTLVRTEIAQKVGGFDAFHDERAKEIDGQRFGEDFDFTLRCREAGAVFRHAPVVTWSWYHHGYGTKDKPGNTSGQPDRWA
jgi:GT2 family glycosyltransferase